MPIWQPPLQKDIAILRKSMGFTGNGIAPLSRIQAQSSGIVTASGRIALTYFTSPQSRTVTQVRMGSGGTAAGATPTLVRMGLYAVDEATGDMELVASTANDPSVFSSGNTWYTKDLEDSYRIVKGQRYASAVIVVTNAATPTYIGAVITNSVEDAEEPRITGARTGQTDLLATIDGEDVSALASMIYSVWY